MFWDKWFRNKNKQSENGLPTTLVAFNKLSNDEEEVYGFTLEFLDMFEPMDEEAAKARFHIDFVNNEDIDF